MGELYNPYPRLPKNIRQIGERDQIVKLYVEDYVNTYLRRLYPTGGQGLRVGLLLGEIRTQDGTAYLFADGALEMDDVGQDGEKAVFTEEAWKKAYQTIEQMFPKRSILGWFLCGPPGCLLSPLNYWKQHGQYFSGKNQLMYLNSGLEGEESIYITSEDGFYKLRGHCIYYERNQMMQDYMVSRKDAHRVESGTRDVVIRDFRQRMEDKKEEVRKKRSVVGMLGMACSVLSVMVLASGVVMFNNYRKMKDMENVIVSAIPSGFVLGSKQQKGLDGAELELEEVPGEVYPTTVQLEINPETMAAHESQAESGAQPETAAAESTAAAAPVQDGSQTAGGDTALAASNAVSYVVQDGETLYGICLQRYQSVNNLSLICQWNQLEDENKIVSGQVLLLPPVE